MKQLFDVTAAAFGIVLLVPLLIVIALLVRQDSTGPVLFRQRRVGRAGVPFDILKFRTMRVEAAGRGMDFDADRRVTRVGAVLRRTKLDELPQLFNVVGGSMSLVGPRPEVPDFVAHYSQRDRAVLLSVRPGITDLASLRFRNEGAYLAREAEPERAYLDKILPRKLRLARYYVRRRSLCFDIILIWKTVTAALGRPSIREPHIWPGGRA
jgi:lipopolysaccharide/colanic/teichoic acid biosynthesis glycosyltransferase